MYPILLEIGRLKLYSFGSFIALGAIVGGALTYYFARWRKLKTHHIFDTVLYVLIAGLIAGRIGYYFTYSEQFQSFTQIFYFWTGGLLALPALAVGFGTLIFLLAKEKLPIYPMLDVFSLGFLASWSIGKIGCHLSTCNLGRFSESVFSLNGTYPVDLFSVLWAGLLFVLLSIGYWRKRLSDGVIFFLALEGLFLGELIIKTLRADFGEGVARMEALIYLALIVVIYFSFWKIHGPQLERRSFTSTLKNLIFRKNR